MGVFSQRNALIGHRQSAKDLAKMAHVEIFPLNAGYLNLSDGQLQSHRAK